MAEFRALAALVGPHGVRCIGRDQLGLCAAEVPCLPARPLLPCPRAPFCWPRCPLACRGRFARWPSARRPPHPSPPRQACVVRAVLQRNRAALEGLRANRHSPAASDAALAAVKGAPRARFFSPPQYRGC